jgi:hypothetical protein
MQVSAATGAGSMGSWTSYADTHSVGAIAIAARSKHSVHAATDSSDVILIPVATHSCTLPPPSTGAAASKQL